MLNSLFSLSLICLAALVSNSARAEQILPLAEAKAQLALPRYSESDRRLIAEQAEFMIENLYVHRELKIRDFGSNVDPVPRLKALTEKAADLKNDELHASMLNIFSDLHDLHTNYNAPPPIACGLAFIPVRFAAVTDGGQGAIVVAQKLKPGAEFTKDIKLGDALLEVDGQPVEKFLAGLGNISGGANPDAMRVHGLQMLSFRNLSSQPMPTAEKVKLKFANHAEAVELPWLAYLDKACLEEQGKTDQRTLHRKMTMGEDEFQKKFNRVFGTPRLVAPRLDAETNKDLLSEVFDAAVLSTPAGEVGYISLKAFYWKNDNLDIETVVEGFRRTIEKSLSHTIALVIDVRGNPGGNIVFAEKLVQLFSRTAVVPTTVRMLANDLNEKIFRRSNGGENRWSVTIRDAITSSSLYTKPLSITPTGEANNFGQVWFKPVVVLTDASCFSACDVFAAGIQDNHAGVILGLHRNTGGGGANVMEYNVFRAILGNSNDNPFKELPFGQNMRVSWRQTIRTGAHAGELIEDKGVVSDAVVALSREDIGGESKALMKKIHQTIEALLPKYQSGLGMRRGGLVLLKNGDPARWTEQVYGADAVDVYIGDQKRATFPVTNVADGEGREVQISLGTSAAQWLNQSATLIGRQNGTPVFRSVRNLLWRGQYAEIPDKGLEVNLEKIDESPLHVVLEKGATGSGWQVVDGKLRIGAGPKYANSVHALAFLPLQLDKKSAKITLDIGLVAEELNDSLRIYALNPDTGDRYNLFAGSRIPLSRGATIELPSDWDRADVVFEFESDENWNMAGPQIENISVTR